MRIRLDLAYDGTAFHGWAKQPGLRSVQGEIERALELVFGSQVATVVAGRTDAGVHASAQVLHFDLNDTQLDRLGDPARHAEAITKLAQRLQGILGRDGDIAVHRSSVAPPGFDARFSPNWRRYEYRLAPLGAQYDPLTRNQTVRIPKSLDVALMNDAAQSLVGFHDFAAYCKPRPEATTIRTLLRYEWLVDAASGTISAHLKADAFCHSMVRALVGACVAVGSGRIAPERVAEILVGQQRVNDFPVMPAHGLILREVGYPDDALLASRALQTRARRSE